MLVEIQKKAYREFYFRPKIIWRAIKSVDSLDRLKLYINAGFAFLRFK